MYMTMIGMAIIAVPRGVFRALVWLIMGVVGWLLAGVEKAYATVSWTWVNATGSLIVNGDSGSDCILIYASGDSVLVSNHGTPTVVTNSGGAVNPGDVRYIEVNEAGGTNGIDLSSVTAGNGFDHPSLAELGTNLYGGNGSDWITGSGFYDFIYGGPGGDHLYGGPSDDFLFHGDPGDGTSADGSSDALYGGTGTDTEAINAGEGDTFQQN